MVDGDVLACRGSVHVWAEAIALAGYARAARSDAEMNARIILRYEAARQMREGLGDSGRRTHRGMLNQALKFIRWASTNKSGETQIAQWDFSHFPPDADWAFPAWNKHGKGQVGHVDWTLPGAVSWGRIIAQLEDETWKDFWQDTSGEAAVTAVAVDHVGSTGYWWTPKDSSDFEMVVWTTSKRWHFKPSLDGRMSVRSQDITAPQVPAGPTAEERLKTRRKFVGAVPKDPWLFGGFENEECRARLAEREQAGGPDELVRKWFL